MKKMNYVVMGIFVSMQIGIDAAQPSYLQRAGQYAGQSYKASREQLARAYQWMKAHPGAALGTALAVVAGATAVGAGMRSSKSVPMQGQTMPNELPIGGAGDQITFYDSPEKPIALINEDSINRAIQQFYTKNPKVMKQDLIDGSIIEASDFIQSVSNRFPGIRINFDVVNDLVQYDFNSFNSFIKRVATLLDQWKDDSDKQIEIQNLLSKLAVVLDRIDNIIKNA